MPNDQFLYFGAAVAAVDGVLGVVVSLLRFSVFLDSICMAVLGRLETYNAAFEGSINQSNQ